MTVDELIDAVTVVDENILEEAVLQLHLFVEAARYRVGRMRRRARAEQALELFSSELGLRIRARNSGGERITNDFIKSRITKNSKYKILQAELNTALSDEEFSKLLLEVCRTRRDAIKIIADAQGYESMRGLSQAEKLDQTRRLSIEARKLQAHKRVR